MKVFQFQPIFWTAIKTLTTCKWHNTCQETKELHLVERSDLEGRGCGLVAGFIQLIAHSQH